MLELIKRFALSTADVEKWHLDEPVVSGREVSQNIEKVVNRLLNFLATALEYSLLRSRSGAQHHAMLRN